ncbi:hypothetical protein GCM10011348_20880 [Marinobacterium nitratireducens]|uniref:ABC transmembrane type-1 domain-containing protein n=1 Tax=Marinobacterium nitratireducens TaxID=518897 RepID=A0A917ZEK0_9GAMM|nr:ABC transporter permease subunit [Marinobacterium nitratireducens]GGO81576.1 hypothetical protein GCM10011348_20880 [Marinobacterium nitratireducens]
MNPLIESASSDLGANGWQTFRRVTLPLILPGVVGGALLSFIISMDDLVITYFISGVDATTLPVFIMSMIRRGVKPEINAQHVTEASALAALERCEGGAIAEGDVAEETAKYSRGRPGR